MEIATDTLTQEQENKLREAHARDYIGTDDDMPDDFELWLSLLMDYEIEQILHEK